ncbi:MAG TPA: hypothetical protein VJ508_14685, partial [Saprospiraceae bacterium]|nr:hypothetical protein [Saprospiraceae bacterium]
MRSRNLVSHPSHPAIPVEDPAVPSGSSDPEPSDALRAGEIYLPDSRRHVSFWDLCYDRTAWESQRPAAYQALGLPVEADAALTQLVNEFRVTAECMAGNLPTNPF